MNYDIVIFYNYKKFYLDEDILYSDVPESFYKNDLEWTWFKDRYPELNRDFIGLDKYCNEYVCYLSTFNEIKCCISSSTILIDLIKWKYV